MEWQFLILIMLVAHTPGYDIQMIKSSGLIEFKDNSNSIKGRNWTLDPPQNRTNAALTIYTIDFRNYRSISVSTVALPDGTERDFPEKKYLDVPFCRVYVKRATTGQVTCKADVEISKTCKQSSVEAQRWPPTISAKFEDYAMLMYYEFIDCPGNEIDNTDSSMTAETTKNVSKVTENDQTTPSATTITTTTTKQAWKGTTENDQTTPSTIAISTPTPTQGRKERHQTSAQLESSLSESLLYTVIALSVLLVTALFLLAIAAWKLRKLSSNASTKTEDIAMNLFNDVTEQATSGHESCTNPDVSSVYAVAGDDDDNMSDKKQTVDNELYQSAEKQDVINELYDCTA